MTAKRGKNMAAEIYIYIYIHIHTYIYIYIYKMTAKNKFKYHLTDTKEFLKKNPYFCDIYW